VRGNCNAELLQGEAVETRVHPVVPFEFGTSDETDLVLAENHATIEYYLRRHTMELPKKIKRIEAQLKSRPDRTAYLVVLRQRGRLVHPQESHLQRWIDQHKISHRVFGHKRWDDLLYRFEVDVYEVRGD